MGLQLRIALCLLLLSGCRGKSPVPADWRTTPLGKGNVTVSVPKEYIESSEPDDTTVITPAGDPGVELRFNAHQLDKSGMPKDFAVQFIRDQAKEKKISVSEKGDKVFFTEFGRNEQDGNKRLMQFWQIGFGRNVIVLSATILEEKSDSPEVKECLEKTVPLMIDSLKAK